MAKTTLAHGSAVIAEVWNSKRTKLRYYEITLFYPDGRIWAVRTEKKAPDASALAQKFVNRPFQLVSQGS